MLKLKELISFRKPERSSNQNPNTSKELCRIFKDIHQSTLKQQQS